MRMTVPVDVLAIEERALNAWPALQTLMVSGWALRLSGGFTKRANSVNALSPCGSFEEVRTVAEALFSSHGLPTVFRISPLAPAEADLALDAFGYRYFDPSLFMTAPLDGRGGKNAVEIDPRPSDEWLEGFAFAKGVESGMRQSHDAIVRSIALPSAFVTIRDSGKPIGFGLGVYERGMVGLFDIVVVPKARGRGVGRALTEAILGWGKDAGAQKAYLNVRRANDVAVKLYSSLGFSEAYAYHYRVPPV
jgi:ribosomal protein S18 acetylase RimI-like enzyme